MTTLQTTIQHVAKRAGVAPITVSRVVNNSGYVSQSVRERVETAVADLGYVPNGLARSLRSRRTHTLALVLTDVTNPFFTTVARGVEDAASAAGYMVILGNTDEGEAKEREYLRMLLQRQVDGILLVPAGDAAEALRVIRQQGTPAVILDRRAGDARIDVVRCDSEGGAYQLGRLLVSLGHRTFAVITGPRHISTSEDRVTGFRRALTEAGLEQSVLVYYGTLTPDSGEAMTREALTASSPPTAIFAANNFLAVGALSVLQERGRRVPEDVALVAFDDLLPACVPFPFLTVADQPAYEMGQRAVALLLERLNGKSQGPFQEVLLDSTVIVRRSSGDPREEAPVSKGEL